MVATRDIHLEPLATGAGQRLWRARFQAMASPCEVLIDDASGVHAQRIAHIAAAKAWRVEQQWSRYRDGNIIHRINTAGGRAVAVDDETANMLDYAETLWHLSEGRFDITSGILRRAWHFDGSDHLPTAAAVRGLLGSVGWHRVQWQRPWLRMQKGMEVDFGGIGKEYAVDRTLRRIRTESTVPVLINFGGDIACDGPRASGAPWQVGLRHPRDSEEASAWLTLDGGGMATSGDAFRYLLRDGIRYGHVLDATTGWPVPGAPASVTVMAAHCTLAGMLATLALLQGDQAAAFLDAQRVSYRLQPQ